MSWHKPILQAFMSLVTCSQYTVYTTLMCADPQQTLNGCDTLRIFHAGGGTDLHLEV